MHHFIVVFVFVGLSAYAAENIAPGERDGQIQSRGDNTFLVWDAGQNTWSDPETFWIGFAERNSGKFWGTSHQYPPYSEVQEHDTLLVEVDSGKCLMYFFHTRWRRANDVRRWGDEFNRYGGCKNVFN